VLPTVNQIELVPVGLTKPSAFASALVMNGQATYTALDLFNFKSSGVLELSPNGGYFSVVDGAINMSRYNAASINGGDIADWASSTSTTQSNTRACEKEEQSRPHN
jgi:hypothetical protein